jgi:dTDP-4-dehydrorhamnose reductase
MNRSLVIGAQGQVGNQISLALGNAAVRAARHPPAPGWIAVDLECFAASPQTAIELAAGNSYEAIYCIGGATDVERCESDRDWAMNANFYGPVALAKAAIGTPFVYVSTEYVFDGSKGPYTEESAPSPISVYGVSKFLAEQEILSIHPQALIIRTTVVYGPDPRGKNFLYTLCRLLNSHQTMKVPIDQVSTPTYNRDLARAIIHLTRAGSTGIFNVCGPELLTRFDFASKAAEIMGLDASLIIAVRTADLNQKAPRPLHAGLCIDKLKASFPSISMQPARDGISAWKDSLPGGLDELSLS